MIAFIAFVIGLYGAFGLAKFILENRFGWLDWPILVILPFVGGPLGIGAACAVLIIILAWILGSGYRQNV